MKPGCTCSSSNLKSVIPIFLAMRSRCLGSLTGKARHAYQSIDHVQSYEKTAEGGSDSRTGSIHPLEKRCVGKIFQRAGSNKGRFNSSLYMLHHYDPASLRNFRRSLLAFVPFSQGRPIASCFTTGEEARVNRQFRTH